MGYSWDTLYGAKKACESGGMEALKERRGRNANMKNRVSEELKQGKNEECAVITSS